jgi:hypothetical protein
MISVVLMEPLFGRSRKSHRARCGLVGTLVAIVSLTCSSLGVVVLAPDASAAALTCRASMSNAAPKQYSTTHVIVSTVGRAGVATTAHYKTTKNVKNARANLLGKATVPYAISGATPGFTVVVGVVVTSGGKSASCSTKFIPQARK